MAEAKAKEQKTPAVPGVGDNNAVPSRTEQQQKDASKDAGRVQGDNGKEERVAKEQKTPSGATPTDRTKQEQSTGSMGVTGGQQVVGTGDAVTVNAALNAVFSDLDGLFQRLNGVVAPNRDISKVLKKLDAARDELAKEVGLEKVNGAYVTHSGYAANPSLLGQTSAQANAEGKAQKSSKK